MSTAPPSYESIANYVPQGNLPEESTAIKQILHKLTIDNAKLDAIVEEEKQKNDRLMLEYKNVHVRFSRLKLDNIQYSFRKFTNVA